MVTDTRIWLYTEVLDEPRPPRGKWYGHYFEEGYSPPEDKTIAMWLHNTCPCCGESTRELAEDSGHEYGGPGPSQAWWRWLKVCNACGWFVVLGHDRSRTSSSRTDVYRRARAALARFPLPQDQDLADLQRWLLDGEGTAPTVVAQTPTRGGRGKIMVIDHGESRFCVRVRPEEGNPAPIWIPAIAGLEQDQGKVTRLVVQGAELKQGEPIPEMRELHSVDVNSDGARSLLEALQIGRRTAYLDPDEEDTPISRHWPRGSLEYIGQDMKAF